MSLKPSITISFDKERGICLTTLYRGRDTIDHWLSPTEAEQTAQWLMCAVRDLKNSSTAIPESGECDWCGQHTEYLFRNNTRICGSCGREL